MSFLGAILFVFRFCSVQNLVSFPRYFPIIIMECLVCSSVFFTYNICIIMVYIYILYRFTKRENPTRFLDLSKRLEIFLNNYS